MEDSGVDSGDVQHLTYVDSIDNNSVNREYTDFPRIEHLANGTRQPKSAHQFQKEIENRIDKARRNHSNCTNNGAAIEQQPRKGLLPINRLHVPGKAVSTNQRDDAEQPLVTWIADSSEDEYEFHPSTAGRTSTDKEISNQLLKDGFNLDLTPDDEDLDLIPPRPIKPNCACCQWSPVLSTSSCSIQWQAIGLHYPSQPHKVNPVQLLLETVLVPFMWGKRNAISVYFLPKILAHKTNEICPEY